MNKLIIAAAFGIAAMGAAQAQTTQSTTSETGIVNTYSPTPYVGVAISTAKNQASDNWRPAAKVFGGYNIDQNWAVELGYTHFGSEDYDSRSSTGNVVRSDVKGSSSYVAGKYTVPVNERVSAYGKLGASYNERKNRLGGIGEYNERDTGLYGAVGVQYALNQNVALVGEYERYGRDKETGAKADALSVGVKYGF
jgi:OmpA-OmpF porin, OOP family